MRRATIARPLLALLVAATAACSGEAPAETLGPNALMTAEQVRAEIETTKARTPLPEGAVWRAIELGPGTYEAYAGGSMVEFQALCAWLLEARDAKADRARFGKAVTVLRQIRGWRIFTDPKQLDDTSRTFLSQGIEAAIGGNFAPINPYIAGNCLS